MKQDHFAQLHEPEWRSLEELLDGLEKRRPGRRGGPARGAADPGALATLPRRYRNVAQHLALARERGYSFGLIQRLEQLTLRGHQVIYRRHAPVGPALARFLGADFPRLVRAEIRGLAAAAGLFFGPMLLAAALVLGQDELRDQLLPLQQQQALESMYGSGSALGRERGSGDDFVMFGYYIRNNTGIGFQTFAGGLLFGLGTLFFLVFNGLYIGAVAGYLTQAGLGSPFWSFVSGHSAFELSAIVLSGAAGLRIGWALVSPGPRTRARALVSAARGVMGLVYGAVLLFLAAAFVEAFWSPRTTLPPGLKYAVGGLLWVGLIAYLALAGRDRGA